MYQDGGKRNKRQFIEQNALFAGRLETYESTMLNPKRSHQQIP